MIPIRVLQSLEKNHGYVLTKMGKVKERIQSHFQKTNNMVDERNEQSENNEYFDDLFIQEENPVSATKVEFGAPEKEEEVEKEDQNQEEKQKKGPAKTKIIEKKNEKKGPKKKKEEIPDLSIDELEEVVKKLTTHITWSYRYIYD